MVVATGCSLLSRPEPAPASPAEALRVRGKSVYMANCIACHNTNPSLQGGLGPEVAGSSLPLLESRILRAEYPAGYKPKRTTRAMAALPQLKADLPALHAFLNP